MRKIFLYLYPIEEYQSVIFRKEDFYREDLGVNPPIQVLEECIQKRYRDKEYEIVFATYPDREIVGLKVKPEDKVILTDVMFDEASGYRTDGTMKLNKEIKLPNPKFLFDQIGVMDEIVVSGFHSGSCVEEVAEYAYKSGVDTLVDLELTERFEYLYRQPEFKIDSYNPADLREKSIARAILDGEDMDRVNKALHSYSPIYHFYDDSYEPTITAKEIVESEMSKQEKEGLILKGESYK